MRGLSHDQPLHSHAIQRAAQTCAPGSRRRKRTQGALWGKQDRQDTDRCSAHQPRPTSAGRAASGVSIRGSSAETEHPRKLQHPALERSRFLDRCAGVILYIQKKKEKRKEKERTESSDHSAGCGMVLPAVPRRKCKLCPFAVLAHGVIYVYIYTPPPQREISHL